MIFPIKLSCAFDGKHVFGVLHDTNDLIGAAVAVADMANLGIGDVVAFFAEVNVTPKADKRLSQALDVFLALLQQVKGKPQSGLPPHSGQGCQLVDGIFDLLRRIIHMLICSSKIPKLILMALIKAFQSSTPDIHPSARLAETCVIVGDVEIGKDSSVWYGAVMRGDVQPIRIGEGSNIQDGAILHASTSRAPCVVGNRVTVGHQAILHGCTVHDEALIGMGAVVLDEAVVPSHTIVAAKALILEGSVLESGFLYAGIPAKKIKPLSQAQIDGIKESATHYIENAKGSF
jgi:carbonic anhydrase/acetyltransferase-like protein (isoleucine patch superfamily)